RNCHRAPAGCADGGLAPRRSTLVRGRHAAGGQSVGLASSAAMAGRIGRLGRLAGGTAWRRGSSRRANAGKGAGVMSGHPLHVFMTADAVGGVWQYAADLCAELAELGHRVTL